MFLSKSSAKKIRKRRIWKGTGCVEGGRGVGGREILTLHRPTDKILSEKNKKKKKITVDLSAKYPSSRPLSVKALKYFLIRFLKALHKTGSKQKKKNLSPKNFISRAVDKSVSAFTLSADFLSPHTCPPPPSPSSTSLSLLFSSPSRFVFVI